MSSRICFGIVQLYRKLKTDLDLMEMELSRFETEGVEEAKVAFGKVHLTVLSKLNQLEQTKVPYRNEMIFAPDALVVERLDSHHRPTGPRLWFKVTNTGRIYLLNVDRAIGSGEDLLLVKYLTGLERFSCRGNNLVELPALPESLQDLDVSDNKIQDALGLPSSLKSIVMLNNPLSDPSKDFLKDLKDTSLHIVF